MSLICLSLLPWISCLLLFTVFVAFYQPTCLFFSFLLFFHSLFLFILSMCCSLEIHVSCLFVFMFWKNSKLPVLCLFLTFLISLVVDLSFWDIPFYTFFVFLLFLSVRFSILPLQYFVFFVGQY